MEPCHLGRARASPYRMPLLSTKGSFQNAHPPHGRNCRTKARAQLRRNRVPVVSLASNGSSYRYAQWLKWTLSVPHPGPCVSLSQLQWAFPSNSPWLQLFSEGLPSDCCSQAAGISQKWWGIFTLQWAWPLAND